MVYGLRVKDTIGNAAIITPKISNIISSGTTAMPTALKGDTTYGVDIDLPGTDSYRIEDVGVQIRIRYSTYSFSGLTIGDDEGGYGFERFVYVTGTTYYTRNVATGAMTAWVPVQYTDSLYNSYPIAFWDTLGDLTFTSIRLFAAMCYLCYDASASTYKQVYTIDDVKLIDYVIYLKNL